MRKYTTNIHVGEFEEALFKQVQSAYYSDIIRAIEEITKSIIRTRKSSAKDFIGHAETWSRFLTISVSWPLPQKTHRAEHWIFYDSRLPQAGIARQLGHELFHILAHNPLGPERLTDKKHRVNYTESEEQEADLFSIRLMVEYDCRGKRKLPITPTQLQELLDKDGVDWPTWISKEETIRVAQEEYDRLTKP